MGAGHHNLDGFDGFGVEPHGLTFSFGWDTCGMDRVNAVCLYIDEFPYSLARLHWQHDLSEFGLHEKETRFRTIMNGHNRLCARHLLWIRR
jgi:hypothetical protein